MLYSMLIKYALSVTRETRSLNLLQNERQVLEYEINYYPKCILYIYYSLISRINYYTI